MKVRSTYQGLEKMVGIFVNVPLYRPRSVRCSRWLLCTVQEELLYSHHTLDCIFRYLTWAFNQLYTGKFPTCGPDGEALTGKAASRAGQWVCPKNKLTFQVTEIRGDWLWHKQVFRFRSSWKGGSNQPVCFKCKAWSKGPVNQLFYNIEENSPLWYTEYPTVADFLVEQCPDRPCTLAYCDLIPGLEFLRQFWFSVETPVGKSLGSHGRVKTLRMHSGPLVCLRYFHQDCIRWCSMHTINLGLCYGTNGSALTSGMT